MDRRKFLRDLGVGAVEVTAAASVGVAPKHLWDSFKDVEPVASDEEYDYYWFDDDLEKEFFVFEDGAYSVPEQDKIVAQFFDQHPSNLVSRSIISKDHYEVTSSGTREICFTKVPKNI